MRPYIAHIFIFLLVLIPVSRTCPAGEIRANAEDEINLTALTELDLDTAATIALNRNPSMAAALDRVEQAMARLARARSAYWPYLDATASYTRLESSDRVHENNLSMAMLFDPLAKIDNPEDYYRAGLTATWVLFNGFERKYMNRAARLGQEQSQSMKDDIQRLLLSAVAETYFAAQLVSENMIISRADKAFNERLLKEARDRSRIGAGSLSDELNFEIRVNTARAQLMREATDYANVLVSLAAVMGLPDAAFPENLPLARLDVVPGSHINIDDLDRLAEAALDARPDMKTARIALQTAETTVKKAKAAFYPDITLFAAIDGERTGNSSFDSQDFGQSAGINMSFNLFSGGADRAGLMEAEAVQREAKRNLEQTRLNITSEVKQAVENVRLAENELTLQRTIADLVQKNRDLVEKEYAAGQTSLVRLNEAQRDLTEARGRLAQAVVSVHQARFNLQTVIGESLK